MTRPRVQVWSDRKMVTLRGDVVPVPGGESLLLFGVADERGEVACVKLDDGRELLIRRDHLEVLR
jgi:hypothetical protein